MRVRGHPRKELPTGACDHPPRALPVCVQDSRKGQKTACMDVQVQVLSPSKRLLQELHSLQAKSGSNEQPSSPMKRLRRSNFSNVPNASDSVERDESGSILGTRRQILACMKLQSAWRVWLLRHQECAVCLDVHADTPWPCCGHRFCKGCIKKLRSKPSPICPLCRTPAPSLGPKQVHILSMLDQRVHERIQLREAMRSTVNSTPPPSGAGIYNQWRYYEQRRRVTRSLERELQQDYHAEMVIRLAVARRIMAQRLRREVQGRRESRPPPPEGARTSRLTFLDMLGEMIE